ncbi:MAG: hypothetical protein KAQ93_01085 [Spirochaetales bacterium]|nr:hypothetical protein [Spirochaetales bacterium]
MFLLETTNIKAINTGLQSNLKSGTYVSFTVNKKINLNMYKILLLGKFISVKSTKSLKEGSVIKAQIFWDNNRLQLKVLEKQNTVTAKITSDTGIFNIHRNLITDELIKGNMPLDPSYFKILEPVLRKDKKVDQKLVKILLLLIDKGITLNDDNINEILSFSDRKGQGHSGKNRKKNKENLQEIKKDIKNQIKNTDTGNELIKYFNHSVAKHDNWLIIPLNFSFTRPGQGVLKLKINESLVVTNLVLTLSDGNDWDFSLVKTSEGSIIKVSGPNDIPWKETAPFNKLKEKLYNMGIIFDDINKEWALTNGFSENVSEKIKSVDFIV